MKPIGTKTEILGYKHIWINSLCFNDTEIVRENKYYTALNHKVKLNMTLGLLLRL